MNSKMRERICFAAVLFASVLAAWVVSAILFNDGRWLYDHTGLVCLVAAGAIVLVGIGIAAMWNYSSVVALTASALIATSSAQAGLFTPAGGDSPNSSPKGSYWSWLLHGWDFGWGFWRDGLDSWQSGHPVITIDPAPPSNSDTSSK